LANEVPTDKDTKLPIKASMAHKREFKGVFLSVGRGLRGHSVVSKGF
jgi:hypothetical protein